MFRRVKACTGQPDGVQAAEGVGRRRRSVLKAQDSPPTGLGMRSLGATRLYRVLQASHDPLEGWEALDWAPKRGEAANGRARLPVFLITLE